MLIARGFFELAVYRKQQAYGLNETTLHSKCPCLFCCDQLKVMTMAMANIHYSTIVMNQLVMRRESDPPPVDAPGRSIDHFPLPNANPNLVLRHGERWVVSVRQDRQAQGNHQLRQAKAVGRGACGASSPTLRLDLNGGRLHAVPCRSTGLRPPRGWTSPVPWRCL